MQEIAEEIGIAKEDIVFALDAIQAPVSLYEPVYSDGGDTLYVMDQVSDKKNREENWIEELSLEAAMERLNAWVAARPEASPVPPPKAPAAHIRATESAALMAAW